MHVRSGDFADGREAFPFVKWGVRLDNDGIHPPTLSGRTRGRVGWRDGREGGVGEGCGEGGVAGGRRIGRASCAQWDDEKNFFPLFLPLAWTCIVIKKARGGLAIRYRGRFFQAKLAEENFPRGRPISSRLI